MPQETPQPPKDNAQENPPTTSNPGHVLLMTLYILFFTALTVILFVHFFKQTETKQIVEEVSWSNERNYTLRSGPAWFGYDEQAKRLRIKGVIDDSIKVTLLKLYHPDSIGFAAYQRAIDALAFKTQTSTSKPSYLLILLLGGLAAMIGVQIRTIYHFLDHACYKKDFNAVIWWPWYVVRPWVGFLLGSTLILLAEVNLFNVANAQSSQIFWIGFSILAGFSTPDVIRRLGKASEAIFGIDDNPRPTPSNPDVSENDKKNPPAPQPDAAGSEGKDGEEGSNNS